MIENLNHTTIYLIKGPHIVVWDACDLMSDLGNTNAVETLQIGSKIGGPGRKMCKAGCLSPRPKILEPGDDNLHSTGCG